MKKREKRSKKSFEKETKENKKNIYVPYYKKNVQVLLFAAENQCKKIVRNKEWER